MKKSFKRIFTGVLCCGFLATAFLVNGCVPTILGGDWIQDLNEALANGEITQEEYDEQFNEYSGGIDLEGIMV